MKKNIITLVIMLLWACMIKAQYNNPFGFDCAVTGDPGAVINPILPGGIYKPECIDCYTTNTDAYFPVLIVYVQFLRDPGPEVEHWPSTNNGPTFQGTVIATQKASGYGDNWYDAYDQDDATLSDYWMEVSRGKLHLVGQEVSVVLPHDKEYYEEFHNDCKAYAMEDLFVALQNDLNINWLNYDKWKKDGNTFVYGERDGYVDMLYIVARSNPCSAYNNPPGREGYFRPNGVRDLCIHNGIQTDEHTVYNQGAIEIKLKASFSEAGSGFQISNGHGGNNCSDWFMYPPMEKWATISFSGHEHGHYLVGPEEHYWEYHLPYSKVNNYHGWEDFLSPYELFRFGYQDPQVVDFSDNNPSIGDWTSRNTQFSQILKVPIGDVSRNEFFIIANRQKVSYYDKIMWGDTAHDNPYRQLINGESPNYGKGVYIYHAYPGEVSSEGYPWSIHIDQECADGLFNWVQDGYRAPDWTDDPWLPYYKRNIVVYNTNDNGGEQPGVVYPYNHDGKSLGLDAYGDWFGLGKKHTALHGDGTDRYWTNLILDPPQIYQYPYEVWTSRENKGDRWDAWRAGNNEVFSPYSSPSTHNWGNQSSGIFVYLESQNGLQANFKIYKVGIGYSESEILQLTPPSKPMNLKVDHCYQSTITPYYYKPKLTWNHNLEPDMRREIDPGVFVKRYNIYRVTASAMNLIPNENNYSLIATLDINENDQPTYVDETVISVCNEQPDVKCPPICWIPYPVRYRVQAVDVYETPSVKSDFASTVGWQIQSGGTEEGGDHLLLPNLNAPKEFQLYQNYPNPFNPATEIRYELPQNAFVTIKIYNALGEEIATLVNYEYKSKGFYAVIFDGTNFASGIYFYTITAGQYTDTKKMVLVK